MEEKDNQTQNKETVKKTKVIHRRLLPIILVVILVAILSGSAGFGVYHYEHNKLSGVQLQLTKSNQDNSGLQSEVATLNKKVSSLTSQLNGQTTNTNTDSSGAATTQTTPVATDPLSIKVLDEYKYYTTKYPNTPYIVVDVTLTNTGASSLTLPVSSFNLHDVSTGSGGGDFGDMAGTTMTNGQTILGDQILAAGQTVTGGLAFSTLDQNLTLYTFSYKNQTFSINANTTVRQ